MQARMRNWMEPANRPVIDVVGLTKRYGAVTALDGVDVAVARGEVHALLGHNGAGKTTLVRILSTLTLPDSGAAVIDGHDVGHESRDVRNCIGVVGQGQTVDDRLTGRENLRLVGRLCHLPRRVARQRADDLLEQFGLTEVASQRAGSLSGGMRRRLDLAAALVHLPAVLLLDEPTAGLDVTSRRAVWALLGDLASSGTTVLLTTQDLREAEHLAHGVSVLHAGRVVADGTVDELKAAHGRTVVELVVEPDDDARLEIALRAAGLVPAGLPGAVRVGVTNRAEGVAAVVRVVDAAAVRPIDLRVVEPTLDDVLVRIAGLSSGTGAPATGAVA